MNGFDLSTASNITIGSAQASAVYIGSNKIWPSRSYYASQYLTITNLSGQPSYVCYNNGGPLVQSQGYYSDDTIIWHPFPAYTTLWYRDTSVQLPANGTLYIKDNSIPGSILSRQIRVTDTYAVSGNIMSLVYGDNFASASSFVQNGEFWYLFQSDTNLYDASDLILPITTLVHHCYADMFNGCTSLVAGPKLIADTLAISCYEGMYKGCTALKSYDLPATTLANRCYYEMFKGASNFRKLNFYANDISPTNCILNMLEDTWPHAATMNIPTNASYYNAIQQQVPSQWDIIRRL